MFNARNNVRGLAADSTDTAGRRNVGLTQLLSAHKDIDAFRPPCQGACHLGQQLLIYATKPGSNLEVSYVTPPVTPKLAKSSSALVHRLEWQRRRARRCPPWLPQCHQLQFEGKSLVAQLDRQRSFRSQFISLPIRSRPSTAAGAYPPEREIG